MLSERYHHTIGEKVPWWGHVRDDVIMLDDGSFFALLEVRGVAWQTNDDQEIAEREARLNHTLCQVAHEQLTLTVYQHRGPASPDIYPPTPERSQFAVELALRYKAHLLDGRLYQNHIFLGVQISPPSLIQATNKMRRAKRPAADTEEDRLAQLDNTIDLLCSELAAYDLARLGVRISNGVRFSQIAEVMHLLLTGVWQPRGITTGRLGDDLFDSHIHIPKLGDVIQYLMPGDERFALMFGIQRPPAETHPLILQRMLSCSYQCTLSHAFRFISNGRALGLTKRKQFIGTKVRDAAVSQISDLSVLADDIASGRLVMGSYSCGILIFAHSADALRRVSSVAWTDLAESGAKITREALGLKGAFLSMIPGNAHTQIRAINATSFNMTSFAPMHSFPTGPTRGHWGAPITLFRSPAGTPVFFHWQAEGDDTGNTLITGENGSGKTTTVAFLLAQTTGRAKIIALDHKRGWDFLIRTCHGRYTVLGDGAPSFAPLKALDASERNLSFLVELLSGCIGGELTADEGQRLRRALEAVMALPDPAQRWLKEVRQFLGVNRSGAGARLERWCHGGELGWVLDAPVDAIDLSGALCGLDTTALLDNKRAAGPALAYLFHRINLALDGKPTLIAVDEGWKALADPIFGPGIAAQIRTIRSKNGVLAFITQGADDITDSGLSGVLVQLCPTQIHLPSTRATEADYVDGLKRTHGEFAALKELHKGSGLFLLCQGKQSSIAQLSLRGMDDILAVLSARESALKEFDRTLAATGDEAEALASIHQTRAAEAVL